MMAAVVTVMMTVMAEMIVMLVMVPAVFRRIARISVG